MTIDDKLYTLKYSPDTVSHLKPDYEQCRTCLSKTCTVICPANVYEWDENEQKLIVKFENCLECGACKIACSNKCLGWEYPKGTKGVTFRYG